VKKLITANDIRAAHARGEQEISVVLRASIITPEAREVAELLGVAITEDDGAAPAASAAERTKPKASAFAKPLSRSCRKGSLPKAWWRS
jgi:ethanolamine utilization protein EutQ